MRERKSEKTSKNPHVSWRRTYTETRKKTIQKMARTIRGISLPSLEYQMTKIRPIEGMRQDLEWNYDWKKNLDVKSIHGKVKYWKLVSV